MASLKKQKGDIEMLTKDKEALQKELQAAKTAVCFENAQYILNFVNETKSGFEFRFQTSENEMGLRAANTTLQAKNTFVCVITKLSFCLQCFCFAENLRLNCVR